MTITASIVIDVDDDVDGILDAEIDSRDSGYNNGDTSFYYTSEPVFLVFKSDNVLIDTIETSEGNAEFIESSIMELTETLTFIKTNTATISKPILTGSPYTYKTLSGSVSGLTIKDNQVTISEKDQLIVMKLTYKTQFWAFKLRNIPETLNGEAEFPIIIYITAIESS